MILPMRFVWGINPADNGDYLDPSDKGTPEWDESFDISDQKSQLWLERFCRDLRKQPFYRSTVGPLLPNCFIETLRSWMQRRCEDPIFAEVNYSPCCENSRFPYKPNIIQQCASKATAEIYRTHSSLGGGPTSAGPKFVKPPLNYTFASARRYKPEIKALVVEYDSTFVYTYSFANMDTFFHQVRILHIFVSSTRSIVSID